MKRKALVFAEHYLPAVKGGGPIRSMKYTFDNLGDDLDFYVITADRDLNDQQPFDVIHDRFIQVGKAKVYYTDIKKLSFNKLRKIMTSENFSVLKLNAIFNLKLSIYPLIMYRLKLIKVDKVILSPRGQLAKSALKYKRAIKRFYLFMAKIFGIYKGVIWHATAQHEKVAIADEFKNANIAVIRELSDTDTDKVFIKDISKQAKELRLVYLSRIHSIKNLLLILQYLTHVKGDVVFSIYGPIEDHNYWKRCQDQIRRLPANIKVAYQGAIAHDDIYDMFHHQHVFILPTAGENYGHVIFEALSSGCPVIISDQTPWRDLRSLDIGFDLNLDDEQAFIDAIQHFIDSDEKEYLSMAEKAYAYSRELANDTSSLLTYRRLFND